MHADSLPSYDDAPAEPISLADLMRQQREIADRNNENQRKREQLSQLEWQRQSTVQTIDNIDRSIRSAQDQLDQYVRDMQERINGMRRSYEEQRRLLNQQETDLEAMREAVDALVDESTDEIEQNIAGIETINSHVRENERKAEAEADAATAEQEYANMTCVIDDLRKQRLSLLNGAPLPLPGLSVDEDNNLTYNGFTWSSMSGSEQLRVATAIVRATKPQCGFVLVDKLEQMDVQTLAEFGAWAQSEGLQVIGTRVSTGDECTIIIEDGMVDGQ
jgi:phage-related tail protein